MTCQALNGTTSTNWISTQFKKAQESATNIKNSTKDTKLGEAIGDTFSKVKDKDIKGDIKGLSEKAIVTLKKASKNKAIVAGAIGAAATLVAGTVGIVIAKKKKEEKAVAYTTQA